MSSVGTRTRSRAPSQLMSGQLGLGALNRLPTEVLFVIFRHLDIPDIIQIRKVCRSLNDISRCREIWTQAYYKAAFVRPPGPFPSQSAQDLENTLVPGFRLHQHLQHGSDTAQALRLAQIRYTSIALRISLVFGRFLLIAFSDEVRCYDALDRNPRASVIYRPTDGTITSFYRVSAIDVNGHPFACVVLKEEGRTENQTRISIYVLNVTDQSEVTLNLLHKFECSVFIIRSVDLGPRVILVQGDTGPSDWHVIAFDVYARTQFLLPSVTDGFWEGYQPESAILTLFRCISTPTRVLLAKSSCTGAGCSTLFEAFALPPSNAYAGPIHLSCSHRGIVPDINASALVVLHDAGFDPSTQDSFIIMRVDVLDANPNIPLLKYGVLRFGECDRDEVGTITFKPLGPRSQLPHHQYVCSSSNGTGRTFYLAAPWTSGTVAAYEYDIRNDDGNDEPVAKVKEYPSVLRLSSPCVLLDYDPYRGRLCIQSSTEIDYVVEIWDLVCRSLKGRGGDKGTVPGML